MRSMVAKEFKKDVNHPFSQQQVDISFIKAVSRRISSESLGHSFKTWFLRTFTNCWDVDDLSKNKSKFPLLKHQYLALLIVYAIAMTEVHTELDHLREFLLCLISDDTLDSAVWQCVAVILFGLAESNVSDAMRRIAVFADASPTTHIAIAPSYFLLFYLQTLHNFNDVHLSMKNAKHFQNKFLKKNRNGHGKHALKLNTVKMLKKVACLAVFQIAAFAFVRDDQHFVKKCSPSKSWSEMVVRLRDDVFNFRVDTHDGKAGEDNEIPPLDRSEVQEAIGYVVLCKFLVFTLSEGAMVMSSPDRQPAKATRKRRHRSSGVHPPGEQLAQMDGLTVAGTALRSDSLVAACASLNTIFEKTLGILTTVCQYVAKLDHGDPSKGKKARGSSGSK